MRRAASERLTAVTYEVKTPVLVESIDFARAAAQGILGGSLEGRQASAIVGAARAMQGAVSTDLKARLAAPKLDRIGEEARRAQPSAQIGHAD